MVFYKFVKVFVVFVVNMVENFNPTQLWSKFQMPHPVVWSDMGVIFTLSYAEKGLRAVSFRL